MSEKFESEVLTGSVRGMKIKNEEYWDRYIYNITNHKHDLSTIQELQKQHQEKQENNGMTKHEVELTKTMWNNSKDPDVLIKCIIDGGSLGFLYGDEDVSLTSKMIKENDIDNVGFCLAVGGPRVFHHLSNDEEQKMTHDAVALALNKPTPNMIKLLLSSLSETFIKQNYNEYSEIAKTNKYPKIVANFKIYKEVNQTLTSKKSPDQQQR